MKNNTAAQHKHCKFFSPGQKAQVLTINAAEQKKHQESLSAEQKVQVMTTDAAAHKRTTATTKIVPLPSYRLSR